MIDTLSVILAVGVIALAVLWIIDAIQKHRFLAQISKWNEISENFIEAFVEVKGAVNTNAGSLRSVQMAVERHEKMLEVLSTMVDVISASLQLNPSLRSKLESTIISDLPTKDLD